MRGGNLVVAFPEDDSFNRRMVADNADARTVVGLALESLLGVRVKIEYELRDLGTAPEAQALAGDELVAEAEAPQHRPLLRTQVERARHLGLFGAPDFVVDGEVFWGNDRLEDALDWARRS